MKKRITGFLLAICMVLTFMPSPAVFASPVYWSDEGLRDVGWYGDGSASAYTLTTPAQLGGLAHLVNSGTTFENKTVTLGANISLDTESWMPIGTQDNPFRGLFDGAGYAVTDMSLTVMTEYAGFFGVADRAMLVNINLSGSVNIAYDNDNVPATIGGLAGIAQGTVIENCSYTGNVIFTCTTAVFSGSAYDLNVGGLAGRTVSSSHGSNSIASSLVNSSMVGDVEVTSLVGHYNGRVGGLVGQAEGTDILNCYRRGGVTVSLCWYLGYVGGLVGDLTYNAVLKNCYSSGTVSLIGPTLQHQNLVFNGDGTAQSNYGDDTDSTDFVTAADLSGWISSQGGDACRPWRDAVGPENGGLPLFAGTAWQTVLSGNGGLRPAPREDMDYIRYYETRYTPKGNTLSLPGGAYTRKMFVFDGWSFGRNGAADHMGSITPSGNGVLYIRWKTAPTLPYTGQLTAGYYSISTAAQLAKLSSMLADIDFGEHLQAISGSVFILMKDIDLGRSDSFDLNGDGDTLDAGETWTGGTAWLPIGGVMWSFEKLTFHGNGHKITGMVIPGTDFNYAQLGLFGSIKDSVISDLYVSGSITVSTGGPDLSGVFAGGIAGTAEESTIVNCGADVDISVTYENELDVLIGGIVGYLITDDHKSVLNCFATGSLVASGRVSNCHMGGIAGYVQNDDIRNCYFAGSISSTASPPPGDVIAVTTGGIAGTLRDAIITHSYFLQSGGLGLAGRLGGDSSTESSGTFSGSSGALTPLPTQTLLGSNLLEALNAWINTQSDSGRYSPWYVMAAYNGSYPQFIAPSSGGNTPISDTGDGRALPLTLGLCAVAALAAAVVMTKKRRGV